MGTLARKAGLERRLKEPLFRMSSSPELRGSELPAELPRVDGKSSVVLGLGRARVRPGPDYGHDDDEDDGQGQVAARCLASGGQG